MKHFSLSVSSETIINNDNDSLAQQHFLTIFHTVPNFKNSDAASFHAN